MDLFVLFFVLGFECFSAQDVEYKQTPAIGWGGNRCYDDFNRPQRCIPEFENAAFDVLMEPTNTCGDHGEIEFCMQTGVAGTTEKLCGTCFPNQHHARYLTDFHHNENPTWWQSESMLEGVSQVNLTLKLGKAFDITYVRLWFYSPRPESFAIFKRTTENGPWIPYQYYSASCRETYGLPDTTHTTRGEEKRALCTSEYSDISPLRGGNVAFGTLEGRPSAYNFDSSPELQEFVTATDLKITLDRQNTFGDELFGDTHVLRSYFYAIADVAVGARCKCNGHASECINSTGVDGFRRRVCKCEHNTAGPDCNECLPFFNDAPWHRATAKNAFECKKCNCNNFSNRCYFDQDLFERTGHGGHCLDCSANRDGPNCERCRENYYMREDGYCVACECDPVGSRNLQCNAEGKCQCKPGVFGPKCDRCEINHYDFGPHGCKNCGCSREGSAHDPPTCDHLTGVCYCKENVEGKRCSGCKPGYFNLDAENEFGCTPCFCYGHSSQCSSTPGYSKYTVESMFGKGSERWKGEDEYRRMVDVTYDARTQSIQVRSLGEEAVYFLAPERYLGDQRNSYNQMMEFKLRIGDNRPTPTATDIILEGNGNYVTNTIFAQQNKIPSMQEETYKFRLHEHPHYGWQPRLTARAFISILTNLTAIRIKGTYASQGVGFLDDFRLDTAHKGIAGEPAKWIESCSCPTGYVGQYCESCAPGFKHSPALGGPFMTCTVCDCNKHADICDSETGRCICQHNTTGDNCELCSRGYYGNALGGTPYDCKPCECPDGGACIQINEDVIMCTECPVGYTGQRCDSCSDGYFGDPTGRNGPVTPCKPCECYGNVDENAIGNCNTTTGECLKCIYNTAGSQCQSCLTGYYGNALALNKPDCRPCQCNPLGTKANLEGAPECFQSSGDCMCKPHVIGKHCTECENSFFNLTSGEGCQSCNCNSVGSFNQSCDIFTGQCYCRPGVTGLRCDHCQTRMFGFSTEGCKDCDCDRIGSKEMQCDASGQCPCHNNVEGRRCDRCKENKYDRQRGCVDCPDCYNLVQDAYRSHNNKLAKLEEILEDIERRPTVISDDKFPEELQSLQNDITEFHDKIKAATGDNSIIQQTEEIRDRGKEISRTLEEVDENIYSATDKVNSAQKNLTTADDMLDQIEVKLNDVVEIFDNDGKEALEKAWQRAKVVGQQSEKMTQIAHQARQTADDLDSFANEIRDNALDAKNKSDQAYEIAKHAVDLQKNITQEENILKSDLFNTESKLNFTKQWTEEVSNRTREAKKNALALLNEAQNLVVPEIDLPRLKERAQEIKERAAVLRNETEELIDENNDLLMEIDEQIYTGKEHLDNAINQQDDIIELLNEVHLSKTQAEKAVKLGDEILNNTQETYKLLISFDDQVKDSKKAAEEALKEIDEIQEIVSKTTDKTAQAQAALNDTKNTAEAALKKALDADELAKNASKNAEKIKNDAISLNQNTTGLSQEADLMADRVKKTESEFKMIFQEYQNNDTLINQAKEKVGKAGKDTQEAAMKVTDLTADVDNIIAELMNLQGIDDEEIDVLEKALIRAEERVREAQLDERLSELQKQQKIQDELINNYQDEIERLKKDVENVEQIAAALPEGCFKRVVLEP